MKHMNVSREGSCGVGEVARELWRAVPLGGLRPGWVNTEFYNTIIFYNKQRKNSGTGSGSWFCFGGGLGRQTEEGEGHNKGERKRVFMV